LPAFTFQNRNVNGSVLIDLGPMSSVLDKFLKSLFPTLCVETTGKERSVFMSNPGQLDRKLKKTSFYISLSDTDLPQALRLTHPINTTNFSCFFLRFISEKSESITEQELFLKKMHFIQRMCMKSAEKKTILRSSAHRRANLACGNSHENICLRLTHRFGWVGQVVRSFTQLQLAAVASGVELTSSAGFIRARKLKIYVGRRQYRRHVYLKKKEYQYVIFERRIQDALWHCIVFQD